MIHNYDVLFTPLWQSHHSDTAKLLIYKQIIVSHQRGKKRNIFNYLFTSDTRTAPSSNSRYQEILLQCQRQQSSPAAMLPMLCFSVNVRGGSWNTTAGTAIPRGAHQSHCTQNKLQEELPKSQPWSRMAEGKQKSRCGHWDHLQWAGRGLSTPSAGQSHSIPQQDAEAEGKLSHHPWMRLKTVWMWKRMEEKLYSWRPKMIALFNLLKRRLGSDLITVCKHLNGNETSDSTWQFNLPEKAITRSNVSELNLGKFRPKIKCKFLSLSVTNPW